MTAKAKKLQLRPGPLRWEVDGYGRARKTRCSGLQFEVYRDRYGNSFSVVVTRAADGLHIERAHVTHECNLTEWVEAYDLEKWREREEAKAIEEADRALSAHREAMTRLNFVRGVRVEDVA